MTTKERIKADAESYAKSHGRKKHGYYALNYIAGATAENDRAQVLVDALEGLLQWHAQPNNLPAEGLDRRLEAARNALAKWDGKEVECPKCKRAVKEGWACNECSTQI